VTYQIRYARQTILEGLGEQGQRKLADATALVVGLGGLGCPASEYLATSGVGRLLLNDFDRVDESNLPRQILYRPGDVGVPKVEAAARSLRELNPDVAVEVLATRLDAAGLAASNDIQGKYVSDINVAGGVITVRFGNDANIQISGQAITLTPDTAIPGSIPWICASGGVIQDKHLPAACR